MKQKLKIDWGLILGILLGLVAFAVVTYAAFRQVGIIP